MCRFLDFCESIFSREGRKSWSRGRSGGLLKLRWSSLNPLKFDDYVRRCAWESSGRSSMESLLHILPRFRIGRQHNSSIQFTQWWDYRYLGDAVELYPVQSRGVTFIVQKCFIFCMQYPNICCSHTKTTIARSCRWGDLFDSLSTDISELKGTNRKF